MAFKQKPPPDFRIQKMREIEERLSKMQAAGKEQAQIASVAAFESRTTAKIIGNLVQQRFEALKARRESNLNLRRQRLAEKLDAEENALREELISSRLTPEQRRAELAGRARAMAAKREAERQALAQSLYERAFQENCDVLREANSKRVLYRTLEERDAQIEQKMATRILESEEKRQWHELNEAEAERAESRHQSDMATAKERRDATLRVLDEQVRQVGERRAEEAAAKQAEVAELHAMWRVMEEEQEAKDAADLSRMKALAFELAEFNRIKRMEISEAERQERELDLKILQKALAQEANDEAREAADRQRQRDEVHHYRAQLALMMQKDAEETAERDAMIEQQAAEQQARRDAELAARDEARRRLMHQVHNIRQAQIGEKFARRQGAREEAVLERMRIDAEAAQAAVEEAEKRAAEYRSALTQRLEIQTQMVAKAHIRAAEEDEKFRAQELAAHAEDAYMGRVHDTLRKTEPPIWHGFKKHQW